MIEQPIVQNTSLVIEEEPSLKSSTSLISDTPATPMGKGSILKENVSNLNGASQ